MTCADNEQGSNLKLYRKIQNRSSAYTDLVKTRGMIRCHVQVIIPCLPLSSFSSKLRTVLEICWSLGGSIPLAKFVGITQKTNCRFTEKLGYQKLFYLMNIHSDLSQKLPINEFHFFFSVIKLCVWFITKKGYYILFR